MFSRATSRSRVKSEGEKPFWISYADLMTALMVMFLVTMAVTVLALSSRLRVSETAPQLRDAAIKSICERIKTGIQSQRKITVDCQTNRIDFGDGGNFDFKEYKPQPETTDLLRALVPVILDAATDPIGEKWLKQVVIEGHTDTTGGYLSNLHLSLERSYWVMCMLVDPAVNLPMQLSPSQVENVRNLFLAGGVSFNDAKATALASRRVELRLQFYSQEERDSAKQRPQRMQQGVDQCTLK